MGNEETNQGTFAEQFQQRYGDDTSSDFKPGNIVKGTVTGINKEVVAVDVGFKSEGIVPVAQFQNRKGELQAKLGDVCDVYILALENEAGQVVLSKERADQLRVWKDVERIFSEDGIVKGAVVQKVKGGLQVDIGIPAFLPGSQIDVRPHRNLDKFIGEDFELKVLKITRDKGNIVLSRRAVLLDQRDSLRSETLEVLSEGVVMEGTVKNVTDYGAFIDLGGIDGLLHITDISWGRVNHPSEKLNVGDTAPVVVLKFDAEKERVSLGMKQLKDDPWLTVNERYPMGGTVQGKVVNLTDYGAFIELEEGVEGLVHVSEMSWTKKVRNPSKLLNQNDKIDAVVLGIDPDERRISLGLKQLTQNPWEELAQRHPIGAHVKGKVRSITQFGIFIEVEEGIDGLVHVSDFSWTKRIKDPKEIEELFAKGDEVEALVLDIDPSNERLSLGIKQLEQDPWDTIAQRYPVGAKVNGAVTSITDFGVFIEIEDGIEGLIHNSQLDVAKGQETKDVYKVGEAVDSEVTKIDRDERRISLSMRTISDREEQRSASEYIEEPGAGAVTFGELIQEKIDSGDS